MLASKTISHAIAHVASQQHGAIATHQLLELGCTYRQVHSMAGRGVLHRRFQGVYAVGHPSLSREGRWMSAVLAGGEGTALSHVSAAQHWGITRRRSTQVHVSMPRYRRPILGVTTHLLRPLQDHGGVVVHHDIPVTTVARTIADLAEIMDEEELEFVMHEADFRGLLDTKEIEEIITRNRRFRGRGRLRRALANHLEGHTGARSRLELRVRRYLESVGVPPSVAGLHVDTPMGTEEVDCGWPEHRIYLEVDGSGHRRPSTRRRDREKDQALQLAGWRRFRISGEDFDRDPVAATAPLRAAFR